MTHSTWLEYQTNKLASKIHSDAEAALKHMDEKQLTDDQKFALAFLAGVPYEACSTNGSVRFTTSPCRIFVEEGKWYVVSNKGTWIC